MMNSADRVTLISERLTRAFSPSKLDIIDDGVQHRGHAPSQAGAGYYTIVIAADGLKDKSRVDAHREIYAVLNDLIPDEIHALQIKIDM